MKKSIIHLLIVLMVLQSCCLTVLAHDRKEHDADIESVLFGNTEYKNTHPIVSEKIQYLEDATYLCVDQFNGSGAAELKNLQNAGISDMPNTIKEFDFSGNYSHRSNTHRGWNVSYPSNSHWDIRQRILRNTVNEIVFKTSDTPFSWLPWRSGEKNTKKQSESFCVLLYYTHVIGDHIEAKKYQDLAYIDHLTNLNDPNNPGIIPDLIKYSEVLFESQKNTYKYNSYIREMTRLKDRSDQLERSVGGVNTEEKFVEYHQVAIDLLQVLRTHIPELLRNEDFFSKTFR